MATARLLQQRAEQGFGPHVIDPRILAQVAAIVLGNDEAGDPTPASSISSRHPRQGQSDGNPTP